MAPEQRIKDLTAQLLRAEDLAVMETVAALLHVAIEQWRDPLAVTFTPTAAESPRINQGP